MGGTGFRGGGGGLRKPHPDRTANPPSYGMAGREQGRQKECGEEGTRRADATLTGMVSLGLRNAP